MAKKTTRRSAKIIWRLAIGAVCFIVVLAVLTAGKNVAVLNPSGSFAQSEYGLIVLTVSVMLAVLLPTITVLYIFAWRYHESNSRSRHNGPNTKANRFLFIIFWGLPIAVLIILASAMWRDTHRFIPDQIFSTKEKPVQIQVVGLPWKWLFIYPEQDIATVNYVRMPVNTPVQFQLTEDQMPMSSFWVPNLGGMLYVMTGHVNKLNLMADKIGEYPGKTAEINGNGYADMQFTADVTNQQDFQAWVNHIKQTSPKLTTAVYNQLLKPSEHSATTTYAPVTPELYATILLKYDMDMHMSTMSTTEQGNTAKHGADN